MGANHYSEMKGNYNKRSEILSCSFPAIIPMDFVHLKPINIFTGAFWPWLPTPTCALHPCQGQSYPEPTCGQEMDPGSSTKAATDPTKTSKPSTPNGVFAVGCSSPKGSSGYHMPQQLKTHISASVLVSTDKPQLTGSGPRAVESRNPG